MKKKIVLFLLVGSMVIPSVVGCGKKNMDIPVEEETETEDTAVIPTPSPVVVETPAPVADTEEADNSETEDESVPVSVSFEHEEKAAVWKSQTTKVTDRWIQIDDVMYSPGCKVSDLVASAENSKVDYESDYVENMLVSADSTATVIFTRDGVEWFTIHALNVFGETKSIKDLPAVSVTVSEYAKPYCYFGAGFSGNDIMGMPYNDIKTACEAGFADWTYSEETVWRNDADCLAMKYFSPYEYAVLPNAEWTGYDITVGEIAYTFYVDVATGTVVDFDPNTGYGEAVWEERPEEETEESEVTEESEENSESENTEEEQTEKEDSVEEPSKKENK